MAVYGWGGCDFLGEVDVSFKLVPEERGETEDDTFFSFLLHHAYGNGTVVTLHFHVDKTRNPFYKLPIFLMSRLVCTG